MTEKQDSGGMPTNPEGQARKEAEEYYARSQESYRAGYAMTEVLRTSENPWTIRRAAMEFMTNYEDIKLSTQNFRSPYDLGRVVSELQDRISALGLSTKELFANSEENEWGWGILSSIDSSNNTGEVEVPGFALGEREIMVEKEVGKKRQKDGSLKPVVKEIPVTVPYIGTDEERKNVQEALKDSLAQVVVRGVLHDRYVYHEKNSENLAGLANFYLHDQLTGEAMKRFYNMPGLWKEGSIRTEGGVELKTVGDMICTAERLWDVVIGLSEKPADLSFYRSRPGWTEYLFPESTVENPSERERQWIGNVNEWCRGYDENDNELGKDKWGFRKASDIDKENEDGYRGLLTEFGNIISHADPEQVNEIRERIRRFLGGGEGAPEGLKRIVAMAEEQAFRISRPHAVLDNRGWDIYVPEDKDRATYGKYKLQMDMGPGLGSDWQKLWVDLYKWKNKQPPRRRDAGPIFTHGRMKQMMVSFPQSLAYKVKIKMLDENGNPKLDGDGNPITKEEKRTVHELNWGYADEVYIDDDGNEKRCFNNGEIKWEKFGRYPGTLFYLRPFMVAREQVGIYDLQRKVNWTARDIADMATHDWWEQLMKRIEVGYPENVFVRGVYKGKDESEIKQKQYEFWSGIVVDIWDGVRNSKIYGALLEEGYKETVGANVVVTRNTIEEIQAIVEDVMGIKLETNKVDIQKRQKVKRFWEKDIEKEYLYPYPKFLTNPG